MFDLERDVLQRSREVPVLVDFWAPWCGPCRMLGPVLDKLAGEADGRWELVKINTEEQPEIAARYGVRGIPHVALFVRGDARDSFTGALPESEIRRWLQKHLPSPHAATLAQARHFLTEGAARPAAVLLETVLERDPGCEEARVLLGEASLAIEPERVEEIVRGIDDGSDFGDRARSLRVLARFALLGKSGGGGLADSPVRERYLEGARAVGAGDYAAALEAFIETLGRDKEYDAAGAREACKAIFQLLGLRHPISDRYHRAFTSALYS